MPRLLLILLISLLTACAGQHRPVPVEERSIGTVKPAAADSSPSQADFAPTAKERSVPRAESKAEAPLVAPPLTTAPPRQRQYQGPSPALLALMEQADRYETQGNYDAALAQLERAQRIAPRDPMVYLQLARLRLQMGDPARAEQLARRGLSLSGQDPELVSAFNALLSKIGR